jgi:hypothetical protein
MDALSPDYHGHAVFTNASGPPGGPFVAAYSTWLVEANNSFRARTQGTVTGVVFPTVDEATKAAYGAAIESINDLIGPA